MTFARISLTTATRDSRISSSRPNSPASRPSPACPPSPAPRRGSGHDPIIAHRRVPFQTVLVEPPPTSTIEVGIAIARGVLPRSKRCPPAPREPSGPPRAGKCDTCPRRSALASFADRPHGERGLPVKGPSSSGRRARQRAIIQIMSAILPINLDALLHCPRGGVGAGGVQGIVGIRRRPDPRCSGRSVRSRTTITT